jgi:PAS domain S-box-containing protein
MRFRTKTIVGVALIEIVLLALLVGSTLSVLRESNEAELMRRVQLGTKLLTVAAKDAVISQDLATLDSLVAEVMASGQVEYVRILDAASVVLAQGGKPEILARPFHQDEAISNVNDGILQQAQPVLAGGIRHGEVQIGVSINPLQILLASARSWAAGIAALEILLVALFSWLLGTYLVRQLGSLRQASERFAAGDFSYRVAVKGGDELAQTAKAFNHMAGQLDDSRAQLRAESAKSLSARQKAERSENLLREAVSSIALGFTIYDEQDRLVHCNEAYLNFYKSSRDLIVPGATFEEIVRRGAERGQYSAATGRVDAWVRQRVAQHQNADGTAIEQQLDDGRWLLIIEHRTPSGYIVGNRIDITERKRMEQDLRASEERWELAVTGANDGIWDWNVKEDSIFFSERWKTMLGYRSDEIGNTTQEWSSRVHPDDLEATMAELHRHLRGETAFYQSEHRLRCKNGEFKWILDRGRASFGADGQPLRMLGSHSDVTERRAMEVREREYADQLKAIFELSPDGFVSFDGAHRVKYVSPAFTRMTGLQDMAVIGLDEFEFSAQLALRCAPDAAFPGMAALRNRQQAGMLPMPPVGRERQMKIEIGDPSKRVLEVSLREKNAQDVTQILYLHDVTHETEVDRLKSEFFSTAAHELRTPMTSIYGFIELLLTQKFDETDWRDLLRIIFRQTELVVSIINELLDLARIEATHGADFRMLKLDVTDLLQEVVDGFKTQDGRAAPAAPRLDRSVWVLADRKKLTQAVLNVLSNAYKYSPQGGAVNLEIVAPATGMSAPSDRSGLVGIRITDHGIGMTAEQLSHVFDRFYRADTSGKIPGTGLGMSIVHEIITLHGGHVNVESTLGAGTTVTIWLPASDAPVFLEQRPIDDLATGSPTD